MRKARLSRMRRIGATSSTAGSVLTTRSATTSSHDWRASWGMSGCMDLSPLLRSFDLTAGDGDLIAHTPIDGSVTGRVATHDAAAVRATVGRAHDAFRAWR